MNSAAPLLPPSDGLTPSERARKRYLSRANMPINLTVPLEDCDQRDEVDVFIQSCMDEGKKLPGVGLLFYGRPGSGKTTHALAILRYLLANAPRDWLGRSEYDAKRPGYYVAHNEFISLHHDSWRDDEYAADARDLLRSLYFRSHNNWENTRLLILDDTGKENPLVGTGHKSQVMHDVIRARYAKGAPTIITTNLNISEWEANYGSATASFLYEAFLHVETLGRDRRRG